MPSEGSGPGPVPLPSSEKRADRLRTLARNLRQPIEYACRDGFGHLHQIRGLQEFVVHQVKSAMAEAGAPPVRDRLAHLSAIFEAFDRRPLAERRDRLNEALRILREIDAAPEDGESEAAVSIPWEQRIQFLKGVGPRRAEQFDRLGIRTVEDLLFHLPWRYEDRTRFTSVEDLSEGADQTLLGTVQTVRLTVTRRKRFRIVEAMIGDGTGSVLAKWFNQPYLAKILEPGKTVVLSGKVSGRSFRGFGAEMENPIYELVDEGDDRHAGLHTGRIVPVYHETRGLTSRQIRTLLRQVLDHYAGAVRERIPASLMESLDLPGLGESLEKVHFPPPDSDPEALAGGVTPFHQRLIFEEFLLIQLGLGLRRREVVRHTTGIAFRTDGPLVNELFESLPFTLTGAQSRVLDEVCRDMGASKPMNRLLQGDVGCGKTVVAAAALAIAVDNGYQGAIMAPTEILAGQHFQTMKRWFEPLGITSVLLTQGTAGRVRKTLDKQVREGKVSIAVGTHALIQEGVRFARLGMAVIDEQHKFGVMQRASLTRKGRRPDVLIMTATPIPRTLALTVYGDLDISVIDEMPKGRGGLETRLCLEPQRSAVYRAIRDEVRAGRQVFVIYPLVDESEKTDLRAAVRMAAHLRRDVFPDLSVGLVHGRLKSEEKDRVMREFRQGRISILVSTTVVEVGLDVPNATVMVIEHADRFGLAQLHQLRGRIGRGPKPSRCFLMAPPSISDAAKARLSVLVASRDGFKVAEEDLSIRGPGEFFGTRQSGLPELRTADLIRDAAWLGKARTAAQDILREDPDLSQAGNKGLREALIRQWKDRLDLSRIG